MEQVITCSGSLLENIQETLNHSLTSILSSAFSLYPWQGCHKAVNLLSMIAGQLPGVVNEKISEKKTLLGVSLNVGTNK